MESEGKGEIKIWNVEKGKERKSKAKSKEGEKVRMRYGKKNKMKKSRKNKKCFNTWDNYLRFNQVTDNLIIEVVYWGPVDSFLYILFLFCLQCQLNEDLLQLLVDKVDTELLKTIFLSIHKNIFDIIMMILRYWCQWRWKWYNIIILSSL